MSVAPRACFELNSLPQVRYRIISMMTSAVSWTTNRLLHSRSHFIWARRTHSQKQEAKAFDSPLLMFKTQSCNLHQQEV